MTPPIRYSETLEDVQPDEGEVIAKLNKDFDEILETTWKDGGHAIRAVHAKAHAILRGTLTIDEALPPELAQGLFATPGEHAVWLRISTNPGDILDDSISVPRGVAMKVLDVAGERLPGAEGATQDFIMVNAPVFQAKTAEEFEGNLKLLAKTTDRAEGAKKALSAVLRGVNTALTAVGIESPKVQSLGGAPNAHPLGLTYYSVTPFRYGDHVAKFSLRPISALMTRMDGTEIDALDRPNAIRETIRADMRGLDAEWAFCVQLCRNSETMPIEDPTVEWPEEESPFLRVGTVRASAQDSWDDAQVEEVNERLRFSIWTGLAAHRPLGNINRARRDTYRHSADFRASHNRCPIHEPA